MRGRRVLAAGIWAVTLALGAPALAACPGQTQLEMNDCAAAEHRAADAELNAVWAVAKPYMNSIGAGAVVLDAQRKWIAFRDAACAAEVAPYEGGSIASLVYSNCLTRLTEQRIYDLRLLLPQ